MIGVITGLAYIVHPPTGQAIAKRLGTALLALFAANAALSFLWSDGIGRLVLIIVALAIVVRLCGSRGTA